MENCKIMDKTLKRDNVFYQLNGLNVSLKYVRDALMFTFMDIPLKRFFVLRGSLPSGFADIMKCLESMLSNIDVEYYDDIKTFIVNNNDKELAEKYCSLDFVAWQLVVLTSRFIDKDPVIGRIADTVGSILKNIYFLKKEILHRDFFTFSNPLDVDEIAGILREVDEEQSMKIVADKYAGWNSIEDAVKKCQEIADAKDPREKAFDNSLINGKFELRSPVNVEKLYKFLADFKIMSGKDYGKSIIDTADISLEDFGHALTTGCYDGFRDHCRLKKLCFVICHFSDAYLYHKDAYREIAAVSLQTTRKNLESYSKDKTFAEGLRKCLPLIDFNDT